MHRFVTLSVLTLVALSAPAPALAEEPACAAPSLDDPALALARTDHTVSGIRVAPGCGPTAGETTDVELPGTPAWVLPDPTDRGRSWLVVLEDGTVEHVIAEAGAEVWISQSETPPLAAGHPPLAAAAGEDQLIVGDALAAAAWFEAPIPDARVTEIAGEALVALTRPTDRYAHGVLGDELEASAVDVRDGDGLVVRVEVGPDEVIEGTSAMVVELGDGPALLVTVSDAEAGARLRLYDLEGAVVAESEPVGQGYRWLHQLGAGPLGPEGEVEIVAVRTPHIGGVVEAYRLVEDRFELVASIEGYSSHQLGSSNLDMALLADADGDGRLEVIVPTGDLAGIAVLARTEDGFEEAARLALDGELATNIAATPSAAGGLSLAVGTSDGRLRIFR